MSVDDQRRWDQRYRTIESEGNFRSPTGMSDLAPPDGFADHARLFLADLGYSDPQIDAFVADGTLLSKPHG